MDPFAQQENDEIIQQKVQPQLELNEICVSDSLKAVDFFTGKAELNVIDTNKEITQLTLNCSK